MLFPAGVLVLLILAAISFDFSLVYQRKRALADLASTAANDAATYGISEERLRADGSICLDAVRARRAVGNDIEAAGADAQIVSVVVSADAGAPGCPTTVTVTLHATAERPFGHAIPGTAGAEDLETTASATVISR